MKRQVDIYIEGTTVNDYLKIDLFDDEKINISSSIQNVQDISKVYTDFSQSFTVPASENNNKIFEYFYQTDVDNSIDHNLRRYAYIEIGLVPFRSGKIQLEGSSVKNGKVEHYSITFYGDLTSLKDTFANDKIGSLNYSFVSEVADGNGIKNRITDTTTDYDIRYPLITSESVWTYGDATSTDLNTSAGRIDYIDLFPAIKVSKIFQAIQTNYGITFQSTFLETQLFKKLFLWCKNVVSPADKKYVKDLTYSSNQKIFGDYGVTHLQIYYAPNVFRLRGGLINKKPLRSKIDFFLDYKSVNCILDIEVYTNDIYSYTVRLNSATQTTVNLGNVNAIDYDQSITLKIKSNVIVDIKYSVVVTQVSKYGSYDLFGNLIAVTDNYGGVIAKQTSLFTVQNGVTNIASNMPDITVADFFSGILKEFNLTCYSIGIDKFQIEPLDNWYSKGATIDVTKYVDIESISIDRLPLYKNVSFSYQKSESFINRKFAENGREYGDISTNYPYDGGEFNISVPFENLNFNRFSNTPLQVGYSLTPEPDFKPYLPKPILLYYNGATTSSIKYYNGTTESTITNIALFGQDLSYNNQLYSLNFSSDNSTWYNTLINNSLFATYYFGYLSNLFNTKNRLTKVTAYFPVGLITSLRLNDRLVIQDKRYIINSINSDITTGEVKLELINDFRKIINTWFSN